MDRTTLGAVGSDTRERIADYRDENDLANYDEALRALLEEATE